jgi:hypothetical protein
MPPPLHNEPSLWRDMAKCSFSKLLELFYIHSPKDSKPAAVAGGGGEEVDRRVSLEKKIETNRPSGKYTKRRIKKDDLSKERL